MKIKTQKAYRSFAIKLIATNLFFFIALFSFFFYSNYQLKEKSAEQITNVIAGQYKVGQLRDVIKALNLVKEDTFEAVGLFDKNGKRIITLPSKVDPDYFKNKGFIESIFYNQIDKIIFYDEEQSKIAGIIKFEFNTWKTFYTSLGIWVLFVLLLLPVYRRFFRAVVAQTENEATKREAEATKKVSSQVWHDLGQPLQLLTAIIENSTTISEIEKGQLLSVAEEVEKIGGELNGIENKVAPILLAPLLKEIIKGEQLKHSRSKHLKIDLCLSKMTFSSLVTISRIDLKRIIANLISNSIDAMKGQNEARIEISLEKNCDDILQIIVTDNGHGMTKEQVDNIGKRGLSYKKDGNGLGVNFIMEKIHGWHGELKIQSEVSKGTSITISLPIDSEMTCIKEIQAEDQPSFVVIDDRKTIHEVYKKSLAQKEIQFFESSQDFEKWLSEKDVEKQNHFFLVDFDLGKSSKDGISIIEDNSLKSKAVLISNHYDDMSLLQLCEREKIRFIPKSLMGDFFI